MPVFDNIAVAILLLRTVTGVLFFFQGYDKIFNVKLSNVVRTFSDPFHENSFRIKLLKPAVWLSSYVELLCGLFLFFGLFRNYTLYILTADLIFVAIAFSSMKAMWDMQYYFPRIIFIVLLLLFPSYNDLFSLDYLLGIALK
jgi:uncharacterized membrane protein YphA (DoxX/SURF4 family)